jgi:diguanylate cyclase (GGDEF)-like protein
LAAPLVSGSAGTAISHAEWGGDLVTTFLTWWLGNATGILLVGALTISLCHRGPTVSRVRQVSAVGETASVVGITWLVFGFTTLPFMYVVLAPLAAVALRHGLRAVAAASMSFALVATFLTALGRGPFTDFGTSTTRVLLLEGFIVITAFIAFLISATMAEQRYDREMLVELATHDQLTGLPNRRLFLEELERAEARRSRVDQMAAVVYLDLDGFKEINDELGHETGDKVLVEVGRRIASGMRDGDFAARIGGDEFAAILQPVTGLEGATAVARRLADLLEHPDNPADLAIKVSFGVALLTAETDRNMREADEDMYTRKHGRAARARVGLRQASATANARA